MKNSIYLALLISVALSACTEQIELDLNTDENVRLVVDAMITTESKAHLVDLTLTTDFFQEGIPDRAEDAVVSISDGTTTEILTEDEPGKYYTSDGFAGEVNKSYTLKIDYDGETYTGTSILPPVATLDSINVVSFEPEEDPFEEEEGPLDNNSVIAYFQEPAELGDFYIFKMLINGEYYTKGIQDWFFTDDTAVNGSYIADAEFFRFPAEPGDTITFEQFSITEEVFDNLNAVLLETIFRGGLFDGAPANVPSNIDNGAIGAFIAADIQSKSVIIE